MKKHGFAGDCEAIILSAQAPTPSRQLVRVSRRDFQISCATIDPHQGHLRIDRVAWVLLKEVHQEWAVITEPSRFSLPCSGSGLGRSVLCGLRRAEIRDPPGCCGAAQITHA